MSTTPYAETECLLAVLEDDDERAAQIASTMTAGEQREFLRRLRCAIDIVDAADPEVL